jgi:hypothetical protein
MALTLAEAAKLSNDILLTGVIETVIQDSPVLQVLPFIEVGLQQVPLSLACRSPP